MSEPDALPPPSPPPETDPTSAVQTALPPSAEEAAAAPAEAKSGGAKTATIWTVAGFVVMQVLRLVSNVILARLLAPEVFGLMTIVTVFIQGLHMFSDIGLLPAIIQSKRGEDPDFLNTAWTIQVLRAIALGVASVLIAWPVSVFYREPVLFGLIATLGFTQALGGFSSTAMATLGRRLYRGRLVLLEIGVYVVTMALTILWVFYWRSVWPLALSQFLSVGLTVGCSHLLMPGYRNRFRWDPTAVTELLNFGKWIFVSTVFAFFAGQTDRLVVGKLSIEVMKSLGLLGVYNFGAMLATMPLTLMYALQAQLLVPIYSRHFQNNWGVRPAYVRFHLAAAGITGFLISGLIASGPTLIRVLYDPRYYQAGWMLQILAVGAWITSLEAANGGVLWALGRPATSALSNGSKVIGLAVLAPLGYWLGDYFGGEDAALPGMIIGFVASDLVRYLITAVVVRRTGMPVFRIDIGLSVLIVVASLPAIYLAPQIWPYRVRPETLGVLAVAPDAGVLGGMPWATLLRVHKKDWANDLVRLFIEGALVLLPWLFAAFVAWRLGKLRQRPHEAEKAEAS